MELTAWPPHPTLPKAELRRLCRHRRNESLPDAAAGILAAALREIPALLPPRKRLGLWWPLPGEPDLRPLAERLPDRVALPAIVSWTGPGAGAARGRRLVYRPWRAGEALEPDGCGIPAPRAEAGAAGLAVAAEAVEPLEASEMALLLVPALAVDVTGLRLGSGGGWYDRLRAEPDWRGVPALAVLPAACVCSRLPRDSWDIRFDGWLDETGLHRAIPLGPTMASS
ncbi:MAG TPA: 5-formyltetrahydrofolate cyclo-ligase [Cyanobium sp.]|nr:5-formyltetrahydrofolate cyclo-ligase [Cyanobium sp.]